MTSTSFQINGLLSPGAADQLARALSTVRGVSSAHIDTRTGTVHLIRRRGMDPDLAQVHAVVLTSGFEVASALEPGPRPRPHEWFRRGWLAMPAANAPG